jgi:uncharacterized protein YxjI
MSKQPPGFIVQPPTAPPQYPGYPNQQQAYPGHQQYPGQQPYPSQQPSYPGSHQPFPAPIQQQPNAYSQPAPNFWYNRNFQTYLTNATSFHVKQKVELLEALIGWETGNKYTVMDQAGNKIFYVGEESNLCGRQLCNARRPFTLTVKDVAGQNVLVMDRKLDCSCCCGLVCPDSIQVSTPSGQLLGTVEEEFSILYPTFNIKDASGNRVLQVQGPWCPMSFGSCGGAVVFRLLNNSGASVGTISKEWSGFIRELLTDSDSFSISFPYDLDPSIKAVLLAALFLIDYEYYESGTFDDRQGGRRLFA